VLDTLNLPAMSQDELTLAGFIAASCLDPCENYSRVEPTF